MKRFIEEFEEIREDLYINTTEDDYAPGGTFGDEVIAFDEGLTREGKAMRSRFNGEALKSRPNHWRGDHPVANDICAAAFIIALDKYRTRQIDERLEKVNAIKGYIDIYHEEMTKLIIEKTLEFAYMDEADLWVQNITIQEVEDFEKDLDEKTEKAFEKYSDHIKHLSLLMHKAELLKDPNYYFRI